MNDGPPPLGDLCACCVSRRVFLTRASTAAAAAALAACGDGQLSSPLGLHQGGNGGNGGGGGGGGGLQVVVGNFPGLNTLGQLVEVTSGVAAKRVTDTPTFVAFDMTCTHQGCLTGLVASQRFSCPCHGSQFDGNGNVTRGPATRPLAQLTTSYDAATDTLTIG